VFNSIGFIHILKQQPARLIADSCKNDRFLLYGRGRSLFSNYQLIGDRSFVKFGGRSPRIIVE
jgi:hypothetical protein